uniref:NADH dehydrogenase subunit 6 n=1 Tax=Bombus waltoni TaxID=395577 RepID=A0A649WEB8_9HYME|nr:NADH dehydrogenase subunit 6 [Bombus waltoni]QGK86776.1 NADH dehydrogenase subunit 6 [Bombus waltoni]
MYFIISINMNINMILILNYYYMNIYSYPIKQLFYLIMYITFTSMNIMFLLPNMTLNLLIILIIFISGILVLFSYFICLLNNQNKKSNSLKLFLINLCFLLISIFQSMNNKLLFKNFNFNFYYQKNQMIKKLYLTPNYFIMITFIIMLIYMLFLVTKMCYLEDKPLRTYKWKK